jgi:hypothetical protein
MKRNQKPKQQAVDPATLAPKASRIDLVLHSRTINALPIINRLTERCRLFEILSFHLPTEDSRSRVKTATAILLLVRNILICREPLYGVGQWTSAFVPELLQLREDQLKSFNDDRVGRAPDRLFDASVPDLVTSVPDLVMDITRNAITEFDLNLSELHNDSTTIRFFGDYDAFEQPQMRRGKATVAIRQRHSKDHRHDPTKEPQRASRNV